MNSAPYRDDDEVFRNLFYSVLTFAFLALGLVDVLASSIHWFDYLLLPIGVAGLVLWPWDLVRELRKPARPVTRCQTCGSVLS